MTLPIVDLQDQNEVELAQALHLALRDHGFLYLKGFEVAPTLVKEMQRLAKMFFDQSLERKKEIDMQKAGLAWRGYFSVGEELTSGEVDRKEGIYFGQEHPSDHPEVHAGTALFGGNQWPSQKELATFKITVLGYMNAMTKLGHQLMHLISLALTGDKESLHKRYITEPTTLFRIFNYPPPQNDQDHKLWGVQEHTDMGFLTLLLQDDLEGLEVLSHCREWVSVPPIKNTLVINIGDMLELASHGLYKATLHRVRTHPSQPRLSYPFFFDPGWRNGLGALPLDQLKADIAEYQTTPAEERWDKLDLANAFNGKTYGNFVWEKVKKVFPHLV